ncbi:MAG TPA: hypothetical protein VH371_02250 [Candidatus Limnocylindrales bacterium]
MPPEFGYSAWIIESTDLCRPRRGEPIVRAEDDAQRHGAVGGDAGGDADFAVWCSLKWWSPYPTGRVALWRLPQPRSVTTAVALRDYRSRAQ